MHAHALSTHADGADPLLNAGGAMEAVRQGTSDARARFTGAIPAIGQFVSRVVYTSCYGLSYGMVFPVMAVIHMVPKNNAMVHGLVDGAIARASKSRVGAAARLRRRSTAPMSRRLMRRCTTARRTRPGARRRTASHKATRSSRKG